MITVKKNKSTLPLTLAGIAAFAAVAVFVLVMLGGAVSTSEREALTAVRNNVMRAVVSCYAYEGFYPDSLEYLEENYNLVINKSKYVVWLNPVGSNIIPAISVEKRGG
ncbi:MAG: hypothetical protein FWE60_03815, partial [Oscillospiraceae bacterium]|nr:hypothetical protein [Oscillospiraceae bacterium]